MVGFPTTGDQIGGYRVDAEIGRGGMGIVYRATQLALNRPVALKILDPRLAADAGFVERFSREAAILASLDSPHIVQIFDHGATDGHLFLAMQYVAGGDLGAFLGRNGPMPPTLALQVFTQILEALGDAHSRGIIHRDVKPNNVLLRADTVEPFAYLCDFGIACTPHSDLTQPGMVAGSWPFMSPERHNGLPATARSDLYSATCVLWMMLTGRNVYTGTDVQVAMAHVSAPVPQLPGSDPLIVALNRLFWSCLAKNPDERPDSAAEVLTLARGPLALAEGVAPLSISKPDSGIFRPAGRPIVADDRTQSLASPTGAPQGFGTLPAPAAPASRGRRVRWLVGAIAVALAGGLVAAAVNVAGVLGRPAAAPTPSPATASPSASPPASAVAVECWNGVAVPDLTHCALPTGKAGLRYVYLSLNDQWGSCTDIAYRPTTDTFDCTIGSRGLIRYRYWSDSDEAERHFTKQFATAKQAPLYLDGQDVGTLYRQDKLVNGTYKLSGLWLEGHFSFSVEAPTIADRDALQATVRVRSLEQMTGHPRDAAVEEGELTRA